MREKVCIDMVEHRIIGVKVGTEAWDLNGVNRKSVILRTTLVGRDGGCGELARQGWNRWRGAVEILRSVIERL